MVATQDFVELIDLVELIMGVVVNCEDKGEYIQRILNLEENTQEDLKKLIERSLQRLSVELSEASVFTDQTNQQELLLSIEKLEKEKRIMRDRIYELESEIKSFKKTITERDEKIKDLNHNFQLL